MSNCSECCYICIHKNKKKFCWACFTHNHLKTLNYKYKNDNYVIYGIEKTINMIDYPGYIFCFNNSHKKFQLVKINKLISDNYLLNHIMDFYFKINKIKIKNLNYKLLFPIKYSFINDSIITI